MPGYYEVQKDKNGNLIWRVFKQYDIENAIKKFNPKDTGARDALTHSVDVDGTKLSASESAMVDDVKGHLLELSQYVAMRLEDAQQVAYGASELGRPEVEAENINIDFAAKMSNSTADLKAKLIPVVSGRYQSKKYLNYFRQHNELEHRPAIFPESHVYELGLLAIILIAEAIANAIFFAHGSDLGLLGGWLEALLVSLANVSTAFISGFICLRYAQHYSLYKKIAGIIGFVITIICLGFLHLATAHYRELVIRTTGASFSDVIAATKTDPFGITDLYSLILILIGVGISLLSIYKGLNFDDVYPGYGKIWRRWERFQKELEAEFKEYRNTLINIQIETISQLDTLKKSINKAKGELKKIMGDVEALMANYETSVKQGKAGAEKLLTIYRSAYQKVIEDAKVMSFDNDLIPEDISVNFEKRSGEVKDYIGGLLDKVGQIEDKFLKKYDSVLASIKDTTSHLSGDRQADELEKKVLDGIEDEERKNRKPGEGSAKKIIDDAPGGNGQASHEDE